MIAIHLHDNISFNMNTDVAIYVDPLITAQATVYTYVYKNKDGSWSHDAMDCEIDWLLNAKRVKSDGFRELYIKLYGKEQLNTLIKNVCTEAEQLVEGRVATSFPDLLRDQL